MSNRLPVLAKLIREAHTSVQMAARLSAERAIEAGQLLIEAKGAVGHGNWLSWLKEHVGISDRTARGYMQLVRSGLKSATVAEMGLRRALGSIANPKLIVEVPDPNEFVVWFSNPPHKHTLWIWRDGGDKFINLIALFDDNRDENFFTFKRPIHQDGLSAALDLIGFDVTDSRWIDFTGNEEAVSLRAMILSGDFDGMKRLGEQTEKAIREIEARLPDVEWSETLWEYVQRKGHEGGT